MKIVMLNKNGKSLTYVEVVCLTKWVCSGPFQNYFYNENVPLGLGLETHHIVQVGDVKL